MLFELKIRKKQQQKIIIINKLKEEWLKIKP
jgi:hypothetical protein